LPVGFQAGRQMMRITTAVLFAIASMVPVGTASAQKVNADDVKWINACITDNKGGASDEVIRKYCMCMNDKMDNNENQSITTWEKSHPKERSACDKESGWK
jgi:hypothetical protein